MRSIPISAIILGVFVFLLVAIDLLVPKDETYRQVAGILVMTAYILLLIVWNLTAKITAVSKRAAKLMLFLDDKALDVEVFIKEIRRRAIKDSSNAIELVFDKEIPLDGYNVKRIIVVSKGDFEERHKAYEATIDYMDWQINHPYVYFLPLMKVFELEEAGEKIPVFKSLITDPDGKAVLETVEAKYTAMLTEMHLILRQKEEALELLLDEPINVSSHSKRVIKYFVKALVSAREAMDKLGDKPVYRDPWFWAVLGAVVLISIIALDTSGIISIPRIWG